MTKRRVKFELRSPYKVGFTRGGTGEHFVQEFTGTVILSKIRRAEEDDINEKEESNI